MSKGPYALVCRSFYTETSMTHPSCLCNKVFTPARGSGTQAKQENQITDFITMQGMFLPFCELSCSQTLLSSLHLQPQKRCNERESHLHPPSSQEKWKHGSRAEILHPNAMLLCNQSRAEQELLGEVSLGSRTCTAQVSSPGCFLLPSAPSRTAAAVLVLLHPYILLGLPYIPGYSAQHLFTICF